jgi:hypothetical protein
LLSVSFGTDFANDDGILFVGVSVVGLLSGGEGKSAIHEAVDLALSSALVNW